MTEMLEKSVPLVFFFYHSNTYCGNMEVDMEVDKEITCSV